MRGFNIFSRILCPVTKNYLHKHSSHTRKAIINSIAKPSAELVADGHFGEFVEDEQHPLTVPLRPARGVGGRR